MMRAPATIKVAVLTVVCCALVLAAPAQAAIDNAGVMDSVLERYAAAVASWAAVVTAAASWLFWTLVLISMVWTFGMMALRKADIGDFFAEFVRFTVFTGFFWWLLSNGPTFANSIFDSLRQLAGNATGLGPGLSPSGIVDVGFAIFDRVLDQSILWSPVDSAIGTTLAGIILVLLTLVSIRMALLLVAGWVLAYGGVFFLGFGGSRWTSDFAVNYFKTVLALAAQLMTMVFLVGIGKTFLDDYHVSMSGGIILKELGVMLVVVVILFMLISRIPPLIAGVVTGARVGSVGASASAFGTAPASPNIVAAAAAAGGAAFATGAANVAAGAQTLMAAFSGASQSIAAGSDLRYGLTGAVDADAGGNFYGRGSAAARYTPFAMAAGFGGGAPVGYIVDADAAAVSYAWPALTVRSSGGAQSGGGAAASSRQGTESSGGVLQSRGAQGQGKASVRDAMGQFAARPNESQGLTGSGWMSQAGGFGALSADDQEQALRSHAEWQSRDPAQNTLGLDDYVSHIQSQQQERKDEVTDFVKRT